MGIKTDLVMERLYLFGLAAGIASIFKLAILGRVVSQPRSTVAFLWVTTTLVALIAQNFFEVLTFAFFNSHPALADWFLKGVVASMAALAVALVNFVATLSGTRVAAILRQVFNVTGLILLTLLASGFVVLGAERGGYSVISTPGPAYPLFQIYILSTVLVCAVVLFRAAIQREDERVARRCRIVLIGTIPMFATGVGVVLLRVLGYDSSSAIFMPIASSYFVYMLMRVETGTDDEIARMNLQWARTWFFARQALKSYFANDPVTLNRFAEQAELQLIKVAMKSCDNNMRRAAKLLHTSPSTVSRRWSKLKQREARPTTGVGHPPA